MSPSRKTRLGIGIGEAVGRGPDILGRSIRRTTPGTDRLIAFEDVVRPPFTNLVQRSLVSAEKNPDRAESGDARDICRRVQVTRSRVGPELEPPEPELPAEPVVPPLAPPVPVLPPDPLTPPVDTWPPVPVAPPVETFPPDPVAPPVEGLPPVPISPPVETLPPDPIVPPVETLPPAPVIPPEPPL